MTRRGRTVDPSGQGRTRGGPGGEPGGEQERSRRRCGGSERPLDTGAPGAKKSIVESKHVVRKGPWRQVGRESPARLPGSTAATGVFLGLRPTAGYLIEFDTAVRPVEAFIVVYAERNSTGLALTVLS